jgi:D-alanyl-D-alanine carboxypeptidase
MPGLRDVPLLFLLITMIACASEGAAEEAIAGEGASTTNPDAPRPTTPQDQSHGPNAEGETKVDMQDLLDAMVAKNAGKKGGGVLRVATEKGVIFEGASGEAAPGVKMTTDARFEIASVTKTFTAVLVMLLVEEGKLALTTQLSKLLPADLIKDLLVIGGADRTGSITVKQLLEHSSGLPDYWNDPPFVGDASDKENVFMKAWNQSISKLWDPKEILPYVRKLTPIHAPGGAHHYSDTNYVLLGLVLERLEGKPFHQIMRERLLEPLGMKSTYLIYREPAPDGGLLSHRWEEGDDLDGHVHLSADWAGGGLVSTTRDLARFMFALAKGELFDKTSTLPAMTTLIPTKLKGVRYGLGIFDVELETAPGSAWGHDGYGSAFMYYWPKRGIVLTGTLNNTETEGFDLIDQAADRLSK